MGRKIQPNTHNVLRLLAEGAHTNAMLAKRLKVKVSTISSITTRLCKSGKAHVKSIHTTENNMEIKVYAIGFGENAKSQYWNGQTRKAGKVSMIPPRAPGFMGWMGYIREAA